MTGAVSARLERSKEEVRIVQRDADDIVDVMSTVKDSRTGRCSLKEVPCFQMSSSSSSTGAMLSWPTGDPGGPVHSWTGCVRLTGRAGLCMTKACRLRSPRARTWTRQMMVSAMHQRNSSTANMTKMHTGLRLEKPLGSFGTLIEMLESTTAKHMYAESICMHAAPCSPT